MSEVKIYCDSCGCAQPLEIEPMRRDPLYGDGAWGDLLCAECHLVIATLTVPEAGTWEFRKVEPTNNARKIVTLP